MLGFVLILAAVAGGTALTFLVERSTPLIYRLAAGTAVGWGAACVLCYLLSSCIGLGMVSILVTIGFCLAALGVFNDRGRRVRLLEEAVALLGQGKAVAAIIAIFFVATLLFARAYYVQPDGIYTSDGHNYGDLSFHFAIVNDFVYGQRFPPTHPSLSGASLTYPFMMDFGSAMLMVTGVDMHDAFLAESTLLFVALLVLLHRWARLLTGDGLGATIAVALVVFSGGLGWWTFLRDVQQSGHSIFYALGHLTRDYTISGDPKDGLRWGNAITVLLLTQRTMLMGIPLALVAFIEWWELINERATSRAMVYAGLVTGLLPLIHAHSYMLVLGLGFCMALLFMRRTGPRPWLIFAGCALALGVPQIAMIMAGSHLKTSGFLAIWIGWDHGALGIPQFWLYNTGLLVPLLLIALFDRNSEGEWLVDRVAVRYYLPFTLCFIVPNLLKLAPWIWDNIKILSYWLMATVPFVGRLLAVQLREKAAVKALACVLIFMLTAAGAIDVWRVMDGQQQLQIMDREGIAFAQAVRQTTPPGALVLHGPVANHPLVLAGRRALMGYVGHVWSQGFDPGTRESDIRAIYGGAPNALSLLKNYDVGYIAVGPQERGTMVVNDSFLAGFPRVTQVGSYTLYQVTTP